MSAAEDYAATLLDLRRENEQLRERLAAAEHELLLERQPWRRFLLASESELIRLLDIARGMHPRLIPAADQNFLQAIALCFQRCRAKPVLVRSPVYWARPSASWGPCRLTSFLRYCWVYSLQRSAGSSRWIFVLCALGASHLSQPRSRAERRSHSFRLIRWSKRISSSICAA